MFGKKSTPSSELGGKPQLVVLAKKEVNLRVEGQQVTSLTEADLSGRGDIILIELHVSGPNSKDDGDFGHIAVEWYPAELNAVRDAVARGIIVVEAAGNGEQDLDDPIYDIPGESPPGKKFPSSWKNPFNPANPGSGAILVGAGNPPAGTHGITAEPRSGEPYVDRARCFFPTLERESMPKAGVGK